MEPTYLSTQHASTSVPFIPQTAWIFSSDPTSLLFFQGTLGQLQRPRSVPNLGRDRRCVRLWFAGSRSHPDTQLRDMKLNLATK